MIKSAQQSIRVCLIILFLGTGSTSVAFGQSPGQRYAVIVGIENYEHENFRTPPLQFTVDDAQALSDLLTKAGYDASLLTDTTGQNDENQIPNKKNIEACISRVLKKCQREDTVIIAFSGHGMQFDRQAESYLCPRDARPFKESTASLVSMTGIYQQLESSLARVRVVLIDASRYDSDPALGIVGFNSEYAEDPPNGVAALFSSSAGQRSFEHQDLQHGVFFFCVLEGLVPKAAERNGQVTFDSLSTYVRIEVPRRMNSLKIGRGQFPNMKADLVGVPILMETTVVESSTPIEPNNNVAPTEKNQVPASTRLDAPFDGDAIAVARSELVKLSGREVEFSNSVGMKFALIPPGKFEMGSPKSESGRFNVESQHVVEITDSFYLGIYEVTQAQYEKVVGSNPSIFSVTGFGTERVTGMETDKFPVEMVSWNDAQEFIRLLNADEEEQRAGRRYRLPTESEWEYACRAGTTGPYSFGLSLNGDRANCKGDEPYGTEQKGENLDRSCTVGRYSPNGFGLYDMHGNVFEWCEDRYEFDYPPIPPSEGPFSARWNRVVRGGSWALRASESRSACRGGLEPIQACDYVGFRVICYAE